MNYSEWRSHWTWIVEAVRGKNGEASDYELGPRASKQEIEAAELTLGVRLPAELVATFTDFAAHADLSWSLDTRIELPPPLREVGDGTLSWSLEELAQLEEDREQWFEIQAELGAGEVWADKLAFARVANGDLLALDLKAPGAPVVYLDHDAGAFHGRVLAPGFHSFISRWSAIGCVGPEWWALEAFMTQEGIDPAGRAAVAWAQWLG